MNDVLLSSKRHDWETPQDFFNALDREFHFTLDPCATKETAKCEKYYTPEENGLLKSWGVKQCSAIPLTEENFQNGLKSALLRANTLKLLC